MPIDASIYQGATLANPAGAFLQGMQLAQQQREHQQTLQLRQQEGAALNEQRQTLAEERQMAIAKAQRDAAEEAKLREVFSSGQVSPGTVFSIVGPQRGAEILKGLAALQEQNQKAFTSTQQIVGTVIPAIKALPEGLRPDAYTSVRSSLISRGVIKPEDAPEQYTPEFLDQALRSALSPKEQFEAGQPKYANVAPGGVVIDERHPEKGSLYTAPQDPLRQQQFTETQRHNKAMEATAAQRANNATNDKTDLSPEGLDAAALNYAKTGTLPPLGNGDRETRKKIINRAAQMMPGLDVASAKADFAANQDSLKAIQKQRDAMGAFEETAKKNLEVFLKTAEQVVDSGSPLINKPLRSFAENVMGTPEMTAYQTARRTVIPEFAKILANPGLSGQLSDTARKEVEDVVKGNATLKQIVAAAKVLRQDVANRTQSYDDQIRGIKDRIGKAQTGTSGAGVTVTSPSGKAYSFPDQASADQAVAAAKAKGLWK